MATLHRFFVDRPLTGGEVTLPRVAARQVAAVLRLRPGTPVVLFDGTGGEWSAQLLKVDARAAIAQLLAYQHPDREPAVALTLCQSLLKGEKFEWVLQKGTELGVTRFVPVLTQRVVVTGHQHQLATTRRERWRKIVVEAAEQCGRTLVPPVAEPRTLAEAVAGPGPSILCWEGERERSFAAAWRGAVGDECARATGVRVVIGPEGGFDPQEVAAAVHTGAATASLGRRILRSETAALAACTIALIAEAEYRSA